MENITNTSNDISESSRIPQQPLSSVNSSNNIPKEPRTRIVLYIALFAIIILAEIIFFVPKSFFTSSTQSQNSDQASRLPTSTSVPTATPTPIPLKSGKETYSVSQGAHNGPTFSEVVFDPLDVKKGDKLTVTVTVRSNSQISLMTGTLQTDATPQSFTFTKIQDLEGRTNWQGSLTLESTLWYMYKLTISATNTKGTSTVTVAPRS